MRFYTLETINESKTIITTEIMQIKTTDKMKIIKTYIHSVKIMFT